MRPGSTKLKMIPNGKGKISCFFFLYLIFFIIQGQIVEACPACWAGYGSGDERFNKPLADLRILYDKEGRAALPAIREILRSQADPLIKQRAIGYLGELKDTDSIPLLKEIIFEIIKKVSFSKFGLETPEFQTRLKVAHILSSFGAAEVADRLWERYERLDRERKMEIPYLLNALKDPNLTSRMMKILDKEDDHQLLLGALNVLEIGGSPEAIPYLRIKMNEWERKKMKEDQTEPLWGARIYYSVLKIKATQAISQIQERHKNLSKK